MKNSDFFLSFVSGLENYLDFFFAMLRLEKKVTFNLLNLKLDLKFMASLHYQHLKIHLVRSSTH